MISNDDLARGMLDLQAAQKKTDEQLAKTDEQLAKTDEQLAKTDAQLSRTDAKLDKIASMYGGVSNNQGDVTEDFYYNSLKKNPVLNGILFDSIEKNVTRSYQGIEDEYDLVLVNGEHVFIIEVKYKAHQKDLDRLINEKAPNFRKLYPLYRNFQHHLGLASFYVSDDLKKEALSQGVTILQRSGDLIETIAA